jgi:hypothetical protein
MNDLALLLFLPWFAILAALFWFYPRQPRGAARRGFDLAALLMALLVSWYAMRWGIASADPNAGAIWKQVLASLMAYAAFLLMLGVAAAIRPRLLRASARR